MGDSMIERAMWTFRVLALVLFAAVAAAQPLPGFDQGRKVVVVADLMAAEQQFTTRGGETFTVTDETVLVLAGSESLQGARAIFEVLRSGMRLNLELSRDSAMTVRRMAVETQ